MEYFYILVFLLVAIPVVVAYHIGHERGFWKGYFERINEGLEIHDGVKRKRQ